MDTRKGNKMIHEFMGWIHSVKNHFGINLFHLPDGDKIPLHCNQTSLEELKYHSSYDWIMPVVDKIEILNRVNDNEHYPYLVTIWKNCCKINDGNNGNEIVCIYSKSKITAVWLAVIAFIEWYNKQTKP